MGSRGRTRRHGVPVHVCPALCHAEARQKSAVILFTDIKAAFYSCIDEVPVGEVLSQEQRAELCTGVARQRGRCAHPVHCARGGHRNKEARILPGLLKERSALLHCLAQDPGDPLADVVFALVFAAVRKELRDYLPSYRGWARAPSRSHECSNRRSWNSRDS